MINIFNLAVSKGTFSLDQVQSIIICKFCRDRQFESTVNRIKDIFPNAKIDIFTRIPYQKNNFNNILYDQEKVDYNLATDELLKEFRGSSLLFSVVSFEMPISVSNTANIYRFLKKINHSNSFIIDQNYNLFHESSLIESSKDVFSVFSRTTPKEQIFLYKTARYSHLSGNIVEIGRFAGGSTCIMASGIKDANKKEKIHSYDINLLDIALENIKRLELESYIDVYTQSSEEGASQWKNNGCPPCRFLLIDGDHEYKAAVSDIAMWTPHLMPGGIIAIHDYGNIDFRNFDVERAVYDEIIKKNAFESYQVLDFMFIATKRFK